MFKSFTDALTGVSSSGNNQANPALRPDIYTALDATTQWISSSSAGDGYSFRSILATIEKHFPGLTISFTHDEVPVIVSGITNMIFEFSKSDGMAAAMALRTWVDSLSGAYKKLPEGEHKKMVGEGIVRGINQMSDPHLVTRDFAPRVQMLGTLKKVSAMIHGAGSAEAKQADAYWSSKFI